MSESPTTLPRQWRYGVFPDAAGMKVVSLGRVELTIGEALRDRHPTRAAAMAEEAIAEAGRRNVPGWTAEDVAWFGARRDEARSLERSR